MKSGFRCNGCGRRPVEFHVKGSEWKKMPAKTKAALAEMVKCAAEMMRKRDYKARHCACELCRLSRVLQRIAKKCTRAERAALEALWNRMEVAEMKLDMKETKR